MRVGFVVISRRFIWQPDVADMEVGRLRSARSWRRRELWEMQSLPEGIRRADEVIERNGDFRSWRAPCKGGAFQWVQAPPGNRSSRKQSEQSWR